MSKAPTYAFCYASMLLASSMLHIEAAADEPEIPRGADPGCVLPNSTTWIVQSPALPRSVNRNTCLAGRYRQQRVISVYTREEGPAVWKALQALDQQLASLPNVKAYVVIFKPLTDEQGYNISRAQFEETRRLVTAANLSRLDVAIGRGGESLLLGKEHSMKAAYSEQRRVSLTRTFAAGDAVKSIGQFTDDVRRALAEQ
ncbi:MAG: hypothetical protein KDB14_28795 [Planctomycetales bacterium]|nr:hypothetical protein [Planctomycetales bacterium]